jgi:predicted O-linked N-acetylglucosamine transferase (SPINDLY family)
MRSRDASAILRMLGLEDLIAANVEEYLALAIRLARDLNWRNNFRRWIAPSKPRLYRDSTCVSALEHSLQRAASGIDKQQNRIN